LFESLDGQDLLALLEITRTRTCARGEVLFRQGDPGDDFVIILDGSVKVELLTPEGKELTLTILKSFQFFGELALFDDMPRSASVSALEETRVMVLGKQDFHRMLHEHPRMFFPITRHLTRRLRILTEDVASLAYLDAYSRVARKLLLLADQLGVSQAPDRVLIPQPLTHQELANLVGATRETVTKILNDMKERGLLSIDQHRITLLRKAELMRALM
jgi:CRP-like cAMP-binding protein